MAFYDVTLGIPSAKLLPPVTFPNPPVTPFLIIFSRNFLAFSRNKRTFRSCPSWKSASAIPKNSSDLSNSGQLAPGIVCRRIGPCILQFTNVRYLLQYIKYNCNPHNKLTSKSINHSIQGVQFYHSKISSTPVQQREIIISCFKPPSYNYLH